MILCLLGVQMCGSGNPADPVNCKVSAVQFTGMESFLNKKAFLPAVHDGGLNHTSTVLSDAHHETEEVRGVVGYTVIRPRQVLHLSYVSLLLTILQVNHKNANDTVK